MGSSGGFSRIDDGTWATLRDMIPKPWPRELAAQDLRYWHSLERAHAATRGNYGVKERPGRPALAATWGWGDRATRNLIASPATWWDPAWGPVPTWEGGGPARVQPGSSQGPETDAQVSEIATPEVQPGSSQGPARVLTRVQHRFTEAQEVVEDPLLRESPTLVDRDDPADPGVTEPAQDEAPPQDDRKATRLAAARERAAENRRKGDALWAEIQAIRLEMQPRAGVQALTDDKRKNLAARCQDIAKAGMGQADLLRAVRWVLTPSDNPHVRGAQSTRDAVASLLRKCHAVHYCELARDEERMGPQVAAATADPAIAAWDRLQAGIPAQGPSCLRGAPAHIVATVDDLGGMAHLCRMTAFDLARLRPAFLAAFHRHHQEPTHARLALVEDPADRPAARDPRG